jgi:hypothetical protein
MLAGFVSGLVRFGIAKRGYAHTSVGKSGFIQGEDARHDGFDDGRDYNVIVPVQTRLHVL